MSISARLARWYFGRNARHYDTSDAAAVHATTAEAATALAHAEVARMDGRWVRVCEVEGYVGDDYRTFRGSFLVKLRRPSSVDDIARWMGPDNIDPVLDVVEIYPRPPAAGSFWICARGVVLD